MSKNKRPTAEVLSIQAAMDITPDGSGVRIDISSETGSTLTPQSIVDAVVDMVQEYYSISEDEWSRRAQEGLNS